MALINNIVLITLITVVSINPSKQQQLTSNNIEQANTNEDCLVIMNHTMIQGDHYMRTAFEVINLPNGTARMTFKNTTAIDSCDQKYGCKAQATGPCEFMKHSKNEICEVKVLCPGTVYRVTFMDKEDNAICTMEKVDTTHLKWNPEVVSNVSARDTGQRGPGRGISVTWTRPKCPDASDVIDYDVIHYRHPDQNKDRTSVARWLDINETSVVIKNVLLPCTNYVIKVQACYSRTRPMEENPLKACSEANEGVKVTTGPERPPEPRQPHAVNVADHSMTVRWVAPEIHGPGIYELSYSVACTIKNPNYYSETNLEWTARTFKTEVTFHDLLPWRIYQCSIKANYLRCPDHGPKAILEVQTKIGAPMKPLKVELKPTGPMTAELIWTPSEPVTGPTKYEVYLQRSHPGLELKCTDEEHLIWDSVYLVKENLNESNAVMTELASDTCFRAMVVSRTISGINMSDWSQGIKPEKTTVTDTISPTGQSSETWDKEEDARRDAIGLTQQDAPVIVDRLDASFPTSYTVDLLLPKMLFPDDTKYSVIVGIEDSLDDLEKYDNEFPNWFQAKKVSEKPIPYRASEDGWDPSSDSQITASASDNVTQFQCVPRENEKEGFRCSVGIQPESECNNNTYCNGPLKPSTNYRILIRVFDDSGWTDSNVVNVTTTEPESNGNGATKTLIICVSVAAALVIIVIVVFLIVRKVRNRPKQQKETRVNINVAPINRRPNHPATPDDKPHISDPKLLTLGQFGGKVMKLKNLPRQVNQGVINQGFDSDQEATNTKPQEETEGELASKLRINVGDSRPVSAFLSEHVTPLPTIRDPNKWMEENEQGLAKPTPIKPAGDQHADVIEDSKLSKSPFKRPQPPEKAGQYADVLEDDLEHLAPPPTPPRPAKRIFTVDSNKEDDRNRIREKDLTPTHRSQGQPGGQPADRIQHLEVRIVPKN